MAAAKSWLFVFDLDQTLLQEDSDRALAQHFHREDVLQEGMRQRRQWTQLMDDVLSPFSAQEITDAVPSCCRVDRGMQDLMQWIGEQQRLEGIAKQAKKQGFPECPTFHQCRVVICSDANTATCRAASDYFFPTTVVSAIVSNPLRDMDDWNKRVPAATGSSVESSETQPRVDSAPRAASTQRISRKSHIDWCMRTSPQGGNDTMMRDAGTVELAPRTADERRRRGLSEHCSANLCKGMVVRWLLRLEPLPLNISAPGESPWVHHLATIADELRDATLLVIGDGVNDWCPMCQLRPRDHGFYRTGFGLERFLAATAPTGGRPCAATLHPWSAGAQLHQRVRRQIEGDHVPLLMRFGGDGGETPWTFRDETRTRRIPSILRATLNAHKLSVSHGAPERCIAVVEPQLLALGDAVARGDRVAHTLEILNITSATESIALMAARVIAASRYVDGGGTSWNDVPWLHGEILFYKLVDVVWRRALLENGFPERIDYFLPEKANAIDATLQSHLLPMIRHGMDIIDKMHWATANAVGGGEAAAAVLATDLLRYQLWGNQVDLSMFRLADVTSKGVGSQDARSETNDVTLSVALRAKDKLILANDLEQAAACIFGAAGKVMPEILSIVMDNSGVECCADLLAALAFIGPGSSEKGGDIPQQQSPHRFVVLHVKDHPFFVSDVTVTDIPFLIAALESCQSSGSAVVSFVGRLRQALCDGRLCIRSHAAWTEPGELRELSADLRAELWPSVRGSMPSSTKHVAVFKGDLNFRRLVGDRYWHDTDNFTDCVSSTLQRSGVTDAIALRTLKSEVSVGIPPAQIERWRITSSFPAQWRTDGKHAVALFAHLPLPTQDVTM